MLSLVERCDLASVDDIAAVFSQCLSPKEEKKISFSFTFEVLNHKVRYTLIKTALICWEMEI